MARLDLIDIKILEELKKDGRMSYNDISKAVDRTEATVRRRVKSMLKEGVIKNFTIDYEVNNSKQMTRATIKIEPDFKKMKSILKKLQEISEVTDIWRLSGECGLFIKVEIPSIEDFNPLIEGKISSIDGIKIIETCFITDVIK
ncbi:MAG: Lrp/AsnC family transcriptional regulator [Promethearchaeota archaeon]|nr:MAG: Lrp/AsnC family transcriptional regulator [Candidatus Lokiarchaeota archaeon]